MDDNKSLRTLTPEAINELNRVGATLLCLDVPSIFILIAPFLVLVPFLGCSLRMKLRCACRVSQNSIRYRFSNIHYRRQVQRAENDPTWGSLCILQVLALA